MTAPAARIGAMEIVKIRIIKHLSGGASFRFERSQQRQRLTTVGTTKRSHCRLPIVNCRLGIAHHLRRRGLVSVIAAAFELLSCLFKQMAVARIEQAVVADFDEAVGQDVLEEAVDELLGGEGGSLDLFGGGFLVLKSNVTVLVKLAEAAIAEGDAEDVGSEVLESRGAVADCLTVNHPILFPDALVHEREQTALFQFVTQLGAEDDSERLLVNQKVWA